MFDSLIYAMFICWCSLMTCYEYALVWFILAILCMSRLDVIVDLDVEIWLRLCKHYYWCRLTPEGHRGHGLG
jgi:hypothetical protein